MDSGIVVTGTKSLFHGLADRPDTVETLQLMSRSLRGMNLGRLGMAMCMLKVRKDSATVSSAAMPPVLLYRASDRSVEEIEMAGYPLGLAVSPEYGIRQMALTSGDALLLMTDGLPERQNRAGEPFGYDRCRTSFQEAGELSPGEICATMARLGGEWAEGSSQEDDVTLVALKMK
ncbi:PP2C family protein-serine/threonine phosphatase [Candidatus Latescibacterota bacterium]